MFHVSEFWPDLAHIYSAYTRAFSMTFAEICSQSIFWTGAVAPPQNRPNCDDWFLEKNTVRRAALLLPGTAFFGPGVRKNEVR